MKKLQIFLGLSIVVLLHGCFENSDTTTKANTDGTRSSVQMQEGKADEHK